jgi:Na+/H+ antiporter NhaC|tara:strand:- start:13405 stop:14808 length:1404 start_codon:yes stop_codon:yes gene_type:complete
MILGEWEYISLLPLVITLLLAFIMRSALVAMLVGTFVGTLLIGMTPGVGLNQIFQASLGNDDFIWICEIIILIGILFELFKSSGVLKLLAERVMKRQKKRRSVELSAWAMGLMIIDDYFSPLLTGAIIRPISDRVLIPREKLAFILDATTASVCILFPFTAWGAYVSSLIAAQGGPVDSIEQALSIYILAIPYNIYPILLIIFTLFICTGLISDFGPMKTAEARAKKTGALIRPGASPLISEDDHIDVNLRIGNEPSLIFELLMPILLIIGVGVISIMMLGSVKIVEAFFLAVTYLTIVATYKKRFKNAVEIGELIVSGMKSVSGALLIIALAYSLNSVTSELGAADLIIDLFAEDLTGSTLLIMTFLITAIISFSTGTSWGAYAMTIPVVLPLAYELTGGQITPLIYQTIAAIAGGGIFGDNASPVSDTTVLSSVGAGSDHIDHVITQLPYALLIGTISIVFYALI